MKRISIVLLAALALSASAATLTMQLPQGCTMVAVSCPDTAPPNPPIIPPPSPGGGFAACAAAGYSMQLVEIGYPLGANFRVDTGLSGPRFGNSDALVIHFRTPAVDPSGTAHFNIVARGGAPNVNRVAALSTAPCIFPLAPSTILPAAASGQGMTFNVSLTQGLPFTRLAPSTDYYITVTNRNGFAGPASCTAADCPVFVDSN